jgi:probable HAF family extracellular repeat protein/autotransporter-associated beta strand protein
MTNNDTYWHAFLYNGSGPLQDIGTLPDRPFSGAARINNNGQIAGTACSDTNGTNDEAFFYSGVGPLQGLGTLSGTDFSVATGINNSGQLVGYAAPANTPWAQHAFMYDSTGLMRDLNFSRAQAINNNGQFTGSWGNGRAFLYNNSGDIRDLGTFGGLYNESSAINESGQVVGYSNSYGGGWFAYLYTGTGPMQCLGTLPGGTSSAAQDINNKGQIVGWSYYDGGNGNYHAFLYTGVGPMQDLNNLIDTSSGWNLTSAEAINEKGQIVGYGYHNGVSRAFLLNPASLLMWTGSTGNSWNDANNWSSGVVPGASHDVIFNAATSTNQITTLGGNQSANSLSFNANASTPITIAAGNTLTLGSGGINVSSDTASGHTINADIALAAPQTWSVNGDRTFNVGGNISGTGPLTKDGNGSIILTGNNIYNGDTKIAAGTLKINGSLSTASAVTVNNSGTLAGMGTVGNVTVNSGGHIAPGDSGFGTLTATGLTLNTGSLLDYSLPAPVGCGFVNVTSPGGLMIYGAGINLYNQGSTTPLTTLGNYLLMKYAGDIAGNGVSGLSVLNKQSGRRYNLSAANGNLDLQISAGYDVSLTQNGNLYGHLDQHYLTEFGLGADNMACSPTAAANSLLYLQNKYPTVYGNALVPGATSDPATQHEPLLSVARTLSSNSYMKTTVKNGTYDNDFIMGLKQYVEDQVPGNTIFEAQDNWSWSNQPDWVQTTSPTWQFIGDSLFSSKDVNIAISWENGGHSLTLSGFNWLDSNNDGIIEKNEGAVFDIVDPWTGNDDVFHIWQDSLNGPLDTDYHSDSWISVAMSMEPVLEPGTLVVLMSGGLFALACFWHRRFSNKRIKEIGEYF